MRYPRQLELSWCHRKKHVLAVLNLIIEIHIVEIRGDWVGPGTWAEVDINVTKTIKTSGTLYMYILSEN